jgi:spermidine synthase
VLLLLPLAGFPFGNDLMKDLALKSIRMERGRVLAFNEDATATVTVASWEDPGEHDRTRRILSVNGFTMTLLVTDTQLMAHLPLALAPAPENVLNICFGMGTTFVAARSAGMEVDFVELCPFVVEAFTYFHEDAAMLDEPGVGKIIADGRNYVLLADKKYDLITIDPPPPPWGAGIANLYTKEFYELCKERLTPDGIICQWMVTGSYFLSIEQYRMLLNTFLEVFPHTTVWDSPNKLGTYLIGTPDKLRLDRESFNAYFDRQEVKQNLSLYRDEPLTGPDVLNLLWYDEDAAREFAAGFPVMYDDLPYIEFPLFHRRPSPEKQYLHTAPPLIP